MSSRVLQLQDEVSALHIGLGDSSKKDAEVEEMRKRTLALEDGMRLKEAELSRALKMSADSDVLIKGAQANKRQAERRAASLSSMVQQMEAEVRGSREKMDALKADIGRAEERCTELTRSEALMKRRLIETEGIVDDLRRREAVRAAETEAIANELAAAKARIRKSDAMVDVLETQRRSMEANMSSMRESIDSKAERIQEEEEERQRLTKELEGTRARLAEAEDANRNLEERCGAQERALMEAHSDAANLRGLLETATNSCEGFSESSGRFAKENASLRRELDTARIEMSLQAEQAALDLAGATAELGSAKGTIDAVREELQAERNRMRSDYQSLMESVDKKTAALASLEEGAESRLHGFRDKLDALTTEIVVRSNELGRSSDEVVTAMSADLERQYESSLASLRAEVSAGDTKRKAMQKMIDGLEQQLVEMQRVSRLEAEEEEVAALGARQRRVEDLERLRQSIRKIERVLESDCTGSVRDIEADVERVARLLSEAHEDFRYVPSSEATAREGLASANGDCPFSSEEPQTRCTEADGLSVQADAERESMDAVRKVEESSTRLRERLQSMRLMFADFTCNLRILTGKAAMSSTPEAAAELQRKEVELRTTIHRLVQVEESIESAVTCMACMSILENPVTMAKCGHNVCHKCVSFRVVRTPGRDEGGLGDSTTCPECGLEHRGDDPADASVRAFVENKALDIMASKQAYRKLQLESLQSLCGASPGDDNGGGDADADI